jgi:Amt family ammonium transporter
MIPVGVIPQRLRGVTALAIGLFTGLLIYPLPGNWLWGGGWLSNLGASLSLGHGLVDFGGASAIFLAGSVVALAALLLFRSYATELDQPSTAEELIIATGLEGRLAVYDEPVPADEDLLPATPMPSAYLPILSMLGAGLVLLGWFGLSTGQHAPTALNFSPAQAAVNGLLAALAAALTAAGYSWFTTRQLNPLMASRGLVAGLIVAMAGAPFVPPWVALVAGLFMGLLLPTLIYFFNQVVRLADELGTLSTYGVSALLSLLLVAFFADGRAGQGWNGVGLADYNGVVGQGVSGLWVAPGFASDWPGQLQAQLVGMGAVALWALLVGALLFQTVIVIARAWKRSGLELAEPSAKDEAKTRKGEEAVSRREASEEGASAGVVRVEEAET